MSARMHVNGGRWFTLTAVAMLIHGTPALAQDVSPTLDAIAARARESRQLPGVSVAMRLGDRLLLDKGYGEADVENHVAATAETMYHIGSITRALTAAYVFKLVSQGQLRLDDTVASRLPGVSLRAQGVTLRHLLTHTAGIPNYSDMIGARERAAGLPPRDVVALFADKPPDFALGEAQRRSTSNYFLLGLIVEAVTKMSYGDYVERELRAVGIRHTIYCDSRRLIGHRARGYERSVEGLANAPHIEMSVTFAAGALCSTAGDLVNWMRALMSGAIIPQDHVIEMTTPVRIKGQVQLYAAGFDVDQFDGHRRIHHEGALDGFASTLAHYPGLDLTIAVLTNVVPAGRQNRDVDVEASADELARAVFTTRR